MEKQPGQFDEGEETVREDQIDEESGRRLHKTVDTENAAENVEEVREVVAPNHGGAIKETLGRVLSRATSRSSYNPGPAPDGGYAAWAACKSLPWPPNSSGLSRRTSNTPSPQVSAGTSPS